MLPGLPIKTSVAQQLLDAAYDDHVEAKSLVFGAPVHGTVRRTLTAAVS